jgi:SNF2 family DNA or RNA helicase
VAENTIEEKIIQLHNTKRDLADSLLEGSDQSARLSLNELIALIKERE